MPWATPEQALRLGVHTTVKASVFTSFFFCLGPQCLHVLSSSLWKKKQGGGTHFALLQWKTKTFFEPEAQSSQENHWAFL